MPRLSPSLIRQASSYSPLLPSLLRECRDLISACNELRWLKEYALNNTDQAHQSQTQQTKKLRSYVHRRSRGEPLQYILGTQPFGDLEILCRKNVLIPRPETEVYTTNVAQLLLELYKAGVIDTPGSVRIADLCSGSGCISLLLHSLLVHPSYDKGQFHNSETGPEKVARPYDVQIHGFDISSHALRLSNENQLHGVTTGTLHKTAAGAVSFQYLDILALGQKLSAPGIDDSAFSSTESDFLNQQWDVIISNPPYISPLDFALGGTTTWSVRNYEPRLALVPPVQPSQTLDPSISAPIPAVVKAESELREHISIDAKQADQFYHAIIRISQHVGVNLVVMEIGDSKQASRVRAIACNVFRDEDIVLETWRDDGSETRFDPNGSAMGRQDVDQAHERAVVVWRGQYASWRRLR